MLLHSFAASLTGGIVHGRVHQALHWYLTCAKKKYTGVAYGFAIFAGTYGVETNVT